ncbi:hypothetical protein [Pedobacter cryophilus]|uniref:Homeodomain phBC6A51-type domain-containing protein n=1 Tax=Pedobacter cryophilus TaxID=2571271 RepID=A0A4U1BWP4_9SPHI|nr:hypothetical protein [Pedobacter cryophilus]TKB95743.1 hypothetical protein FA046_15745 [Pedobacter cryophilus]
MKNNRTIQQKKIEVLNHLTTCCGIKTVGCRRANVGRTQFYEWQKIDAEFAFKVREIDLTFLDYVESNLIEMIHQKDRAATMFYLKAKGRERGYR